MRRVLGVAAAILTLLGMSDCSSPSLHTLSTPDSLMSDPGLVGEWVSNGGATRVIITEGAGGKYEGALTVHLKSEFRADVGLEVALTEIGKDRYADLYLAKRDRERLAARYGFLVLPVHQIMMIQRDGDTLKAWTFDPEWMLRAGADNVFACEVLPIGGREIAVITATSGSLRSFLREHAHDPGALSAPMVFRRAAGVPSTDAQQPSPSGG